MQTLAEADLLTINELSCNFHEAKVMTEQLTKVQNYI